MKYFNSTTSFIGFLLLMIISSCKNDKEKLVEGVWLKERMSYNQEGYYEMDSIEFILTDSGNFFIFNRTVFEDANIFHPIFSLTEKGKFEIPGRTETSPEIFKLNLEVKEKWMCILSDNDTSIHSYLLETCLTPKDSCRNITESGCSVFPPISLAPIVYQSITFAQPDLIVLGEKKNLDWMNKEESRPQKVTVPFFRKLE